jgi:transcriptional regulator with XRE-family HTH domain
MSRGTPVKIESKRSIAAKGGPSARGGTIDIGERVRQLRKARDWTLEHTSERTGIAHSTLSKIERGELSPTFGTIQRIAAGFEIEIVTLLTQPQNDGGRGRRSVTRAGEGPPQTTPTCRHVWLAADLANKRMLPFLTTVRARSRDEYSEWAYHPGEMFVHVLRGVLIVHSEFYEPLTLNAGDSVYYDGGMGHVWLSGEGPDAEVLWSYSAPR